MIKSILRALHNNMRIKARYALSELFPRKGNLFSVESGSVAPPVFFDIEGKHVFFGYYDLPQISPDGTKMLVHTVDKNANPAKDPVGIGYFDLPTGGYHRLASTRAWCWQQGSRLRWHPTEPDKVLYNDVDGGAYVTKAVDVGGGAVSPGGAAGDPAAISPALYDISCDFRYGVSLNFSRLQRLRPGYGYGVLPDSTAGVEVPDDDGVFLIDLQSGDSKLIVSMRELAQRDVTAKPGEHYINHVSFCPNDGSKFIFFHIEKSILHKLGRKINLYLYDIRAGSLDLIESDWTTSHYAWRGNSELMTTAEKDGATMYFTYDFTAKTKNAVEHAGLRRDGHPSFFAGSDKFVTDTSPDKKSLQKLFVFDMKQNESRPIAEFYHKPLKSQDMRCDLHPRLWEKDGKRVVTIDTTCNGLRQVALIGDLKYNGGQCQ